MAAPVPTPVKNVLPVRNVEQATIVLTTLRFVPMVFANANLVIVLTVEDIVVRADGIYHKVWTFVIFK